MRRPSIFFRNFAGSGPLSAYWHDGPYGDAVEARGGAGVGWFAPNGEVLGVEFDDVAYEADEQVLEFANGLIVRARVRRGKARVDVESRPRKPKAA
jgi:hypothetical protein